MSSITSFREEFYNAVFTSSSLVKREEQGLENLDTQLVILNKECCRYRSMFQRACRSGDSATIEICRKVSLIFRELKYNLEVERDRLLNPTGYLSERLKQLNLNDPGKEKLLIPKLNLPFPKVHACHKSAVLEGEDLSEDSDSEEELAPDWPANYSIVPGVFVSSHDNYTTQIVGEIVYKKEEPDSPQLNLPFPKVHN